MSPARMFWATLVSAAVASAQSPGRAPAPGLEPLDPFAAFKLPPVQDAAGSALQMVVAGLQVGSRAASLGLNSHSAVDAWNTAQSLLLRRTDALQGVSRSRLTARAATANPTRWTTYAGATASGLNQLIASPDISGVEVTSADLSIDQPIEIRKNGFQLDFGDTRISGGKPGSYMIRIENSSAIIVSGGHFVSGDSAILVSLSSATELRGINITGLTGAGIVVTNSSSVTVRDNRISGIGLAGITLHRLALQNLVEYNEVTGNLGFSNMTAGIVLTDREVDLTANPRAIFGPGGYWVIEQSLVERVHPPHDNLIAWNNIDTNRTSGIYVDGGVKNVLYANVITGNAKEGICLDNGATANVAASNQVVANGARWGQPDAILALDSVLSGGRLPDGTAAEKVPGISLDNAIYNLVFTNRVAHNYGGGIKMVRTGYFNGIGLNTILDDNDGSSEHFHFFGIELGAAPGDSSDPTLDYTPSRGNILFSNSIRGSHYSGIFFDNGSDANNVLDNVILDATNWALEAAVVMHNLPLNNYTNIPSRNMGSGLDPALLTIAQPVYDTPQP